MSRVVTDYTTSIKTGDAYTFSEKVIVTLNKTYPAGYLLDFGKNTHDWICHCEQDTATYRWMYIYYGTGTGSGNRSTAASSTATNVDNLYPISNVVTDRSFNSIIGYANNSGGAITYSFTVTVKHTEYYITTKAYTGSSESSTGGSVTESSYVIKGNSKTFTATPNAGYSFVGWYSTADKAAAGGTPDLSSDASYTRSNISSDTTIYARFDVTRTLSLLASPVEGGRTIDYGGGSYAAGQTVMITVATNSGYIFDGWYKNGVKIYQRGTYIFTMPDEDLELEARWVEDIFGREYETLKYIESTGLQAIRDELTGSNYEIDIDFERTTTRPTENILFSLSNENTSTYRCYVAANSGEGIKFWSNDLTTGITTSNIIQNDEITHLSFKQDSNSVIISDGDSTSSASITPASTGYLYLLSYYDGTTTYRGNFKIYNVKVKLDNTLVRNFIPARRKVDNVLGLYDLINSNFYTDIMGNAAFQTGIYKIGEKRDFLYITGGASTVVDGSIQSFRVDKTGLYKLEVTGGKGGLSSQKTGYSGDGGYSLGYKVLKSGELIYVGCGGGLNRVFNGGGLANTTTYAGNGGGATHVAKVTGTLETIGASNLNDILIIAGGGGGQGEANSNNTNLKYGGAGGGLTGADATGGTYNGAGGTQSEGGSTVKDNVVVSQGTFGKGGDGQTGYGSNFQAGGGGAGLYGGSGGGWGTGTTNGAGGGGSGYIGGVPEIIYKGTTYTPETIQGGVTGGFDYVNYDRLDWIESTGTQYINTGYAKEGGGDSAKIITDIEFTDISSSTQIIFGSVATSASYYYYNQYIGATSNNKWILQWRNDDSSSRINGSWLLNTKYKVDGFLNRYSGRYLRAWDPNNTQVASIGFSGSDSDYPAYTFYLFAGNMDGTPVNFCKMKCYSAQCYKGGTLVRNYIPAKRKSDDAIGLLDTLHNVFYGNAGTGAFNAGPSESVYGHGHATLTLLDMSSSTRKHIIAG